MHTIKILLIINIIFLFISTISFVQAGGKYSEPISEDIISYYQNNGVWERTVVLNGNALSNSAQLWNGKF